MTNGDKNKALPLTDKQIKAIPHLIAAGTYDEGCKKARISRNTLYKWLKDPPFKTELQRHRDVVIEEALDTLKGNINKAVDTLVSLLGSAGSDSLKRLICNDIIGHTIKSKELEDLEERITALEKTIGENKT